MSIDIDNAIDYLKPCPFCGKIPESGLCLNVGDDSLIIK